MSRSNANAISSHAGLVKGRGFRFQFIIIGPIPFRSAYSLLKNPRIGRIIPTEFHRTVYSQEIAASDQDSVLENGSVRIKAGDSYEKDSPVILSCSNEFHGAMEKKPVPTGSIFTDDTDAGGPERRFAPEDDGESRKRPYISLVMAKSSENGYNWRKYGQKLVKGSECPRSYYRCTHPNCPVKKKVEQSDDGEMKVIIYKGAHNHQKPQPPRRRSAVRGSPLTVARNVPEIGDGSGIGAEVDIEVEPLWGDIRSGPEDEKLDDLEGASLTSVMTEISEAMSSIPRGKGLEVFESVQAPELSSALASHGIDEDDVGEEADDNELDYKRRLYSYKQWCYLIFLQKNGH